jgi:hypothetical protein
MAVAMAITMCIIIQSNKSEAHGHPMDCQETAVRWVVNSKEKFGELYLFASLGYSLWLWLSVYIHPQGWKVRLAAQKFTTAINVMASNHRAWV